MSNAGQNPFSVLFENVGPKKFDKSTKLFHYTNHEAAISILSKQEFWLSNAVNSKNDPFETKHHIKHSFYELIRLNEGKDIALIRRMLAECYENLSKLFFNYILCLTKNEPTSRETELHWIDYGGDDGICIEIATENLLKYENNDIKIITIDYSTTNFDEALKKANLEFEHIIKSKPKDIIAGDNLSYKYTMSILEKFFMEIITNCIFYKPEYFKKENEFRLSLLTDINTYVPTTNGKFIFNFEKNLIKKIYVRNNNKVDFYKSLLKHYGYSTAVELVKMK